MKTQASLEYSVNDETYAMVLNLNIGPVHKYARVSDIPPESMKTILDTLTRDFEALEESRECAELRRVQK